MSVDRNEKIWAESNTGTRMHAFVQPGTDGNLRAMCRSTIERTTGARYVGKEKAFLICSRCVKLAVAMWNRAEASLEPADPYSDGFHTVDETSADTSLKIVGRKPMDLDRLHAEALEMDAAGESLTAAHRDAMTLLEPEEKPVRWHYRARRMTSQGAFLGVVEGYMTDAQAIRVERRVRDIYGTPPGISLTNFVTRPAQ